jgi:hypothetical protein
MSFSMIPQLPASYKSPLEPQRLHRLSPDLRPAARAQEVPDAL